MEINQTRPCHLRIHLFRLAPTPSKEQKSNQMETKPNSLRSRYPPFRSLHPAKETRPSKIPNELIQSAATRDRARPNRIRRASEEVPKREFRFRIRRPTRAPDPNLPQLLETTRASLENEGGNNRRGKLPRRKESGSAREGWGTHRPPNRGLCRGRSSPNRASVAADSGRPPPPAARRTSDRGLPPALAITARSSGSVCSPGPAAARLWGRGDGDGCPTRVTASNYQRAERSWTPSCAACRCSLGQARLGGNRDALRPDPFI